MLESFSPTPHEEQPEEKQVLERDLRPGHLDVASVMKEKNCFFVHTIQVTDTVDVSENNKSIDTKKLSTGDRLDILYAASPTLSASSVRPRTNDGTFYGGFGVLFSQGEIVSASQSDEGTVAVSLTERGIVGGSKNSKEDIQGAIDRDHNGAQKSYNEIVLKSPEVAGGFLKTETFDERISYEESSVDYGPAGGGKIVEKIGILNLKNERNGSNFDITFETLLEMQKRGPVFLMNKENELLRIVRINEATREIEFSIKPIAPKTIAELGEELGGVNNEERKQKMIDRLAGRGIHIRPASK